MEKKTCQAANATPVEVCAKASVQKVFKTAKALYFSNADGISFRLTNEGKKGWRLQTSKNDNSFDPIGASQELALFMKEEVKDDSEEITVNKCDCALTVTAADGSYVTLSLSECFAMNVCTAKGVVVSAIRSVKKDGKNIIVTGALSENEAIYGGGERFDTTNKRGTKMALYSCDGWNNSYTTYVVVPLFLTTQGGGMFFNRNEYAVADFGKANADEWSYFIESEVLDCYFYATGKMEDALLGYTLLSGHAYLPTPWMQDVQICRYWPDFWSFDKDLGFDTIEEVPDADKLYLKAGDRFVLLPEATAEEKAAADRLFFKDESRTALYRGNEIGYSVVYGKSFNGKYYKVGPKFNPRGDSVKTIIQSFIDEDMKPAVASLEGKGWSGCFADTDASRKNKEDLIKSVNWLHDNGVKAMGYIRAGGISQDHIGFKPEYKVIADVDVKQEDGSIKTIENTTGIPWIVGTGDNPENAKRADGSMRTGDYLDITNDEAVDWYFNKIWGESIDIGIDGVKIDFCECMPDGERDYNGIVTHYKWKNPDRIVKGTEHHAYPVLFISAFYKRMIELQQAKGNYDGFMVFTRGGGIGSQRNPYMWAGDQVRCFEKLGEQLRSVVNSGMSGVPYMSYDMAGYDSGRYGSFYTTSQEEESEIFARAIEFTAFTTNIQTHGDVRHAYEMTEETKQIYRNFTKLHVELLPYMQKYSKIACDTGIPPVRHPVLQYPDDINVYSLNEEFLLGEGLYVAPITKGGTFERELYLPRGNWTNLLTGEVLEGGKKITVKANLGQIPLFLNNDSADAKELAPIFEGENWTAIKNF